MRNDDDDPKKNSGDKPLHPDRDARGRWLPKYCPNPNGRRGNKKKEPIDLGDLHIFGNMLIEVRANGQTEMMTRRAALLNKMYQDAMKSNVSMQKFLYGEFERNDKRLAAARLRYEELMINWVVENPDFKGLDDDNIPLDVQTEIMGLQALLHHYYPGSYRTP